MLDSGFGVKGAKRIGEMLARCTSLKQLDLSCESPLNSIPVSFGCYLMACLIFIWGEVIDVFMILIFLCVWLQGMKRLETKEPFELQKDWRRTFLCRFWILNVCFDMFITHSFLASIIFIFVVLVRDCCVLWRLNNASHTCFIFVEWMNDRLWNWGERCERNRRDVRDQWISDEIESSGWESDEHPFLSFSNHICLNGICSSMWMSDLWWYVDVCGLYLWTSVNPIGDEGIIRIAEGLEKNATLNDLCIRGVFHPLHLAFAFLSLTLLFLWESFVWCCLIWRMRCVSRLTSSDPFLQIMCRLWNRSSRCKENRRDVGDQWIFDENEPLLWDSDEHPFLSFSNYMCLNGICSSMWMSDLWWYVDVCGLYLWTSVNPIEDEGVIRIAEGLEKNTSLKELLLRSVFLPL